MELKQLLEKAVKMNGSDVFIVPGAPVTVKVNGRFVALTDERAKAAETEAWARETYELAHGRDDAVLVEKGDDDFSFSLENLCRIRCNVYRQRGSIGIAYRVVAFGLPDPQKLGLPKLVMNLTEERSGMILVTGPAGSGKSTTLACMLDRINETRSGHIVTIEDPIEYLHNHKKSLVSQREVPTDSPSFFRALRSALRQAPDVIMLGEMRDGETMQTAITAAETGHLLLSSLHTVGAAKTIDRILDAFPPQQQAQVRTQLSVVLRAVVSQRLIPTLDGKQTAVFEVMTVNNAVQNMIRDGKTFQIDNVIYSGTAGQTMLSLDSELYRLFKEKRISAETAFIYAVNPEVMKKRVM